MLAYNYAGPCWAVHYDGAAASYGDATWKEWEKMVDHD